MTITDTDLDLHEKISVRKILSKRIVNDLIVELKYGGHTSCQKCILYHKSAHLSRFHLDRWCANRWRTQDLVHYGLKLALRLFLLAHLSCIYQQLEMGSHIAMHATKVFMIAATYENRHRSCIMCHAASKAFNGFRKFDQGMWCLRKKIRVSQYDIKWEIECKNYRGSGSGVSSVSGSPSVSVSVPSSDSVSRSIAGCIGDTVAMSCKGWCWIELDAWAAGWSEELGGSSCSWDCLQHTTKLQICKLSNTHRSRFTIAFAN